MPLPQMPDHSEQHQSCASLKQFYFVINIIQDSRKELQLYFLFSALYSVIRHQDPSSGSLLSITLMFEWILCIIFILRKSPLLFFWVLVLPAFNYLLCHFSSLDCGKYTRCWKSNLQVFLTLFNKGLKDGFSAEVGNLYLVKKGVEWVVGDPEARNLRENLATWPLALVGSPSGELSSVKWGQ